MGIFERVNWRGCYMRKAILLGLLAFLASFALVYKFDPQLTALTHDAARSIALDSRALDIVDGDTIRVAGVSYRLVGFDTPEKGDRARCDFERRLAGRATERLRRLVTLGRLTLTPQRCACWPGTDGTKDCNYGRRCGVLSVGGRNVGDTLILEGLAHRFDCGPFRCPSKEPWC